MENSCSVRSRAGLLGPVTWSPSGHGAGGRCQPRFPRRRPLHRDERVREAGFEPVL